MALNTRIRGVQIKDADIDTTQLKDDAVTNAKLANITRGSVKVGGTADAPTDLAALTDKQILIGDGTDLVSVAVTGDITISNAGVTAIGATKVIDSMINDDVATGLAGVGLSDTTGVMAVDLQEVGEVVMDVAVDYVAILDGGISGATKKEKFADIIALIAGSGLTATNGVLSADAVSDNIVESDFQKQTYAGDDSTVIFSVGSTPVTNSVQVFLNGLIQEEGSGKDYTLSGTNATFATAPITGSRVDIYSVINN